MCTVASCSITVDEILSLATGSYSPPPPPPQTLFILVILVISAAADNSQMKITVKGVPNSSLTSTLLWLRGPEFHLGGKAHAERPQRGGGGCTPSCRECGAKNA